ncbi:MAG: Flp pilus assembly protein CpaB [Firmicutes bacterium]|nr:Flp pilus assembly protein CpaB [Bacillota bacterium]
MFRHRFLITAVLLALLATKLTSIYIRKLEEQALGQGTRVQVVVAKTAIPQGTKLKQSHVIVRWWPVELVPQGAVTDPAQVENQIAAVDFVPGDAIITSRLVEEQGQSLTWRLSPGERAVAVAVRGVDGLESELTAGRRVDILGTFLDYSTGLENSVLVLEDVRLLDVATRDDIYGGGLGTQTVVLAVAPEEAQKLALFTSSGYLQLLLRPESEGGRARLEHPVLTVRDLFGGELREWGVSRRSLRSVGESIGSLDADDEPPQKTVEVIRGTVSTIEACSTAFSAR